MKPPTKTSTEVSLFFNDGQDGTEHHLPKDIEEALCSLCLTFRVDRDYHQIDIEVFELQEGKDLLDLIGILWALREGPGLDKITIEVAMEEDNA